MTEEEFQRQVIELAQAFGWLAAHFRPAKTERGWRTAVQGDGAGFPDLVLVRGNRVVYTELKSDKGRISEDQQRWLDALKAAGQEVHVWRPRDAELVEITLKPLRGQRHR